MIPMCGAGGAWINMNEHNKSQEIAGKILKNKSNKMEYYRYLRWNRQSMELAI